MSVRLPELRLLAPADLLKAAERILEAPTCNVQRVSMDEIYTFAVATTQLLEICELAAALVTRAATPADARRLLAHLQALGLLPAAVADPSEPEPQEPAHG